MKRCPQCYRVHEDGDRFCEVDGHELLADPAQAPQLDPLPASPAQPSWLPAAALGVLIGVVIGAGIFIPFALMPREKTDESPSPREAVTATHNAAIPTRAVSAPDPAPTTSPEESPSPDAEAAAEAQPAPAANTQKTAAVQLNQGPISTGQKTKPGEVEAGMQTVIEMNDGSTLDVDAAWEDKQGIWYRRSGLVSFVESSRVKAISARKGSTKPAEIQDR
jgi:cytoskeletal protein RodZ